MTVETEALTFTIADWKKRKEDLATRGYTEGTADNVVEAIDAGHAARMRCPLCGAPLTYVPMTRVGATTGQTVYHAYACCEACNKALAF